ncbi:hypothetical protein V1478_012703 [Vespula squamosa]|uniref:Uncharacterized protein n=1 Tax=Vespula squamosa TaxID=30214 RepID=A0ABD2A8Q2_VESSQ
MIITLRDSSTFSLARRMAEEEEEEEEDEEEEEEEEDEEEEEEEEEGTPVREGNMINTRALF